MTQFCLKDIQKLELFMGAREEYNDLEEKYFLKTQKHVKNLRYIPGLRFIAIGNSIAMKSSHQESDIDLFIVTEKKRLWLVRICMTLYFSVYGLRKTEKRHAGSFCLSFFTTTESLDFSNIAIEDDIYLFYWLLTLKPILDYNNTYDRLMNSNTWGNFNDFPEYTENSKIYCSIIENKKESTSIFYKYIDVLLQKLFLPKTKRAFQKLGKPFGVIIDDNMLKFHNNDKRKYFSQKIAEGKAGKKLKNT